MNDSASLGPRLAACYEALPAGLRVADVGADHARLAIGLVAWGRAPSALVVERLERPLGVARAAIGRAGLSDRIEARLGDGLSVLLPGEVEAVCLAGLGARSMAQILARERGTRDALKRLVLQPLQDARPLRRLLRQEGWCLVSESLVREGGRLYELLVATRGDGEAPYEGLDRDLAELVGPCLMRERGKHFAERVEWLRQRRERALEGLARSDGPNAREKKRRVRRELDALTSLQA